MNRKQKLILIALIFAGVAGLFCVGDFALADNGLEVSGYPAVPGDAPEPGKDTTLPQYLKYLFNFGIAIGGILVFLMFIFAGILWSTSHGNPTAIGKAKSKMFGAMAGLALLLLSYVIVVALNPELKIFKEVEDMLPTTGAYIIGTLTGDAGDEQDKRLYQGDIPSFRENFAPETIEFISDKDELYSIFAYDEKNYQGDAKEIINEGKGSTNDISGKKSIAFFWNKPGVYIYEDTDHQGKRPPKYCFGPINDLDSDQWDNRAQSIRFNNIYGNTYGAVLFTDNDFEARECSYAYENDVMDLSSGSDTYIHPIGVDTLSSLQVFRIPDAVEGKVTVYDSIDCMGRKKEYTPTEVMVFDDLTKDGCSIGDCLFDKINENDPEKELHRNIKSIKIEGDFYVLLGAKPGDPPPPPPPAPPVPPKPENPHEACLQRVAKARKDGIKIDIVRPTSKDLKSRFPETRSGWRGPTPTNFACNEVCAARGQDCLSIGLFNIEVTACKYIIHNHGMDCQISENLEWGECEMGFRYGSGFCQENSPVVASWGYCDTGCYCVEKGYLPDEEDE